jgi:hypothetical protein
MLAQETTEHHSRGADGGQGKQFLHVHLLPLPEGRPKPNV